MLDAEHILRVLHERERAAFMAQYHRAVDAAHDPASLKSLSRFLRLWAMRAVAVSEPDFYEDRGGARTGTGVGMPLSDAIRQYHQPLS